MSKGESPPMHAAHTTPRLYGTCNVQKWGSATLNQHLVANSRCAGQPNRATALCLSHANAPRLKKLVCQANLKSTL
jgi:hypothetical protein